jgi:hypothetical protein
MEFAGALTSSMCGQDNVSPSTVISELWMATSMKGIADPIP